MKYTHRIIALILVIIMLLTILPFSALASYKYELLNLNKWYKLKDYSSDMTVYKMKVSTDTVCTFNWKDYGGSNYSFEIYFYTDKACKNQIANFSSVDQKSGSKSLVMYPGTYYIEMFDSAENSNTKVKVTEKTVSSINKPNYCLTRAITLAKKKKAEFAQTKKEYYPRWYKIKLSKSQAISIFGYGDGWEYGGESNYELYDDNYNEIRCEMNDGVITTYGVQKKGTYYLVLSSYLSDLLHTGKCFKIYWK